MKHNPLEHPGKFQPLPLLFNAHAQTLLAYLFKPRLGEFPSREVILQLSDGDSLLLMDSRPPLWEPGHPAVILVHGLAGCHNSSHVVRVGNYLFRQGWRVIRMNQRGAGPGIGLAKRPYNAGRSSDVREVFHHVQDAKNPSPLFLAGFSLGGNLVLKLGLETPDLPGLAGIAAMGPPIDLLACSRLISQKKNRIYEKHFLAHLRREVEKRIQLFPDHHPPAFPKTLSLFSFDDLYTAPRGGFSGADEYYRLCSTASLIPSLQVPTFILTAHDDPFIAVAPFEPIPKTDYVEVEIASHGGHLGFLGRDRNGGIRWGETRIIHWLESQARAWNR